MYTAAQRQAKAQLAKRQEVVHDVLKDIPLDLALMAIKAHIEARDISEDDADHLMRFANEVGRIAWAFI